MTSAARTVLSDWVLKLALMGLAFAAATLLLRDIAALPVHVALAPLEGWHAYLAEAAMDRAPLYPGELMINTYPPLSFYLLGALGRLTGDAIIAGRILSLISFAAITAGMVALLRQLGANVITSLFAGLVLGLTLLAASGVVAVNDPALLGHALQFQGLLLLLNTRPATIPASLLFAAGLLVKLSLLAMPLAAILWLLPRHRREAALMAAIILGLLAATLGGLHFWMGADLSALVPRSWLASGPGLRWGPFLVWAALPLVALVWLARRFGHDRWVRFAVLYAATGLVMLLAGAGITDCAVALGLSGGLALTRFAPPYRGAVALIYALPLALYLGLYFRAENLAYREVFQRQARLDIAMLEVNRGPALCENLALCYWAGKAEAVDVPNLALAFGPSGGRDDQALARLLASGHYQSVQLARLHPFALGPHVETALAARYRVQHRDNNGVFLLRR